jgi:hypothetical protein
MSLVRDGDEWSGYVKTAVISNNKFLVTPFIGDSVETRPNLETLENENTFARAEDPTQIPLLSYPYRIQYAD